MKKIGKLSVISVVFLLLVPACSFLGRAEETTNNLDVEEVMNTQIDEVTDDFEEDLELFAQLDTEPVSTRSDPLPLQNNETVEGMSFSIVDLLRPADDLLSTGDEYGVQAVAGTELVLLTLNITCQLDVDGRCYFDIANAKLVGSSGIVYPINWDMMIGSGEYLDNAEMFGEAQLSGALVFSVNVEEQGLLFLYDSFYDHPFFMKTSE